MLSYYTDMVEVTNRNLQKTLFPDTNMNWFILKESNTATTHSPPLHAGSSPFIFKFHSTVGMPQVVSLLLVFQVIYSISIFF